MNWKMKQYKKWESLGKPINDDVLSLNMSKSKYSLNFVSLDDIHKLRKLQKINCSHNRLNSFKPIKDLNHLQIINCSYC